MKKTGIFLVALLACCTIPAFAGTGIMVKASKGFSTNLEINVPEVQVKELQVLGRKAVSVTIPDGHSSFEKDAPQLPYLSAMVMIDPMRKPTIEVTKGQAQIVKLEAPILPSKGNFTRNIPLEDVPYNFGKVYSEDKWFPADNDLVKFDAPFIFRDIRGIRLLVNPVQYNPIKNQIRIYKSLKVSIGAGAVDSENVKKGPVEITKSFEPIYKNVFINYKTAAKRLPLLQENGRLLIICYDKFMDALQPFVAWKLKTGNNVVVAKSSDAGTTADEIKAFIQKEYDLGGLTNIMLIGDGEQIPTLKGVKERADSDPCYTKLAGDDHVPDAIISRLSANTPEEVAYQVAKFVNYEQFPTEDKSWYCKGVGLASNEGNPKDWEYMDQFRTALMGAMFAEIDKVYDPGATKEMVFKAVNEGRSLINYLGHGSGTSWGTTRFNNSDVNTLSNGWKMPIIWDVACVNGKFLNYTGFGETWLRTGNIEKPAGAVAYAGSTTNMQWVPPIKVQEAFNKEFIANKLYQTVGGIFINGIIRGLEIYGTASTGSGVMMYEQWHIFGDGTLLTRFEASCDGIVKVSSKKNEKSNTVSVKVTDKEGKPVSNARVNVYTDRFDVRKSGDTNDEGEAVFTIETEKPEVYVTVIGSNLTPVVDQKVTF